MYYLAAKVMILGAGLYHLKNVFKMYIYQPQHLSGSAIQRMCVLYPGVCCF